jgi:hypothetical protein
MEKLAWGWSLLGASVFAFGCDDEALRSLAPGGGGDAGIDARIEAGREAGPDAADAADVGSDVASDADGGVLPPFVEQGGGTPAALAIAGTHAFAAIGPRVVVWDIANRANPAVVGQTDRLPGFVTAIAVTGNIAYVAERRATGLQGDVHYYDVSNPAAPLYGGIVNYGAMPAKQPQALVVDGDVLYIADSESGVYALDITQRTYPLAGGFVEAAGANGLALGENRLWVQMSGFLGLMISALDTTTPLEPAPLASYAPPVVSALGTTVVGDKAFVMDVEGLYVFRLGAGDPVQLSFDPAVKSRSIARAGSNVFVAAEDGVYAYDAAGATVSGGKVLELPTHRTVVIAAGGNALVSMGEDAFGHVFETTAQRAVTHRAAFDLPVAVAPRGVASRGSLLYVGDMGTGLRIVDERTLQTVGRVDRLRDDADFGPIADFEDLALSGDHVYMANWFGDIVVVDVSDPARPAIASSFDLTGFYPSAIAASGKWLYVADSTNDSLFRVIDAADPKKLVQRGTLPVVHTLKLVARDGLVLAADQGSSDPEAATGVLLIDVTDPDAPALAGRYSQDCGSPGGVAVDGDVAAASCDGGTLHLIDIRNPAAPRRLARHELPIGTGYAVLLRDGKAYVADDLGVSVVDVTDPARPRNVRRVALPFTAYHLAFSGSGRLIAPAVLAGVFNLEL